MTIEKYPTTFVLDFDSTFTRVEALDLLAQQLFSGQADRQSDIDAITQMTHEAMNGTLGFAEALRARIAILKPSRDDIERLVESLKDEVSASIARNQAAILKHSAHFLIVSGGFHDYIAPIVAPFGIGPKQNPGQ